jgi:hypothetical protein
MVCTHFLPTVRAPARPAITNLVRSISTAARSAQSPSAVSPLIRDARRKSRWSWRRGGALGEGIVAESRATSPSKHSTSAPPQRPHQRQTSVGHRWSRFGRSASRRSSASRQASSARRAIAFIASTSILAPRSDCDERRLGTGWRTHASCCVPPAGRTPRPCGAAPWLSSRSSSARICFSAASETRLRLTYSPHPGHAPRLPAHEKRQPQKQATSISDRLPRPMGVPRDASSGL